MKQAELVFTTDNDEIDVDFVADFLSNQSYWAKGRSTGKIARTIHNSFCIGMFIDNTQIGFARAVTDFETMAYLMDVFIDPAHQGKGYGKQLMSTFLQSPQFANVRVFSLKTEDADGFYKGLGFTTINQDVMRLELY